MAGEIKAGSAALVMDAKDHVATAIKELAAGEQVSYRIRDIVEEVTAAEPIPFGHKIAIADIPEGTHIRKYGEVIGRATAAIAKGQHVHVHNVEGIRGRGDQANPAGGATQ